MIEELIKLGLSEKEAKVYLTLLELGEETVQSISRKSGVKRATVYVALERLSQLGLVSTVERGKKTLVVAQNPIELNNLLEEEQIQLDNKRKYMADVTNRLLAVYNAREDKPLVRYFEGRDGLIALERYGHDVPISDETMGISPIDLIEKYFPEQRSLAVKKRVDENMRSRLIYTHENGEIPENVNQGELREAVYLSKEEFPIDETIRIYPGWGVKIFNFDPNNFFGVVIQSANFAKNMQHFFELAWRGAKQIKEENK